MEQRRKNARCNKMELKRSTTIRLFMIIKLKVAFIFRLFFSVLVFQWLPKRRKRQCSLSMDKPLKHNWRFAKVSSIVMYCSISNHIILKVYCSIAYHVGVSLISCPVNDANPKQIDIHKRMQAKDIRLVASSSNPRDAWSKRNKLPELLTQDLDLGYSKTLIHGLGSNFR